MCRWVSTAGTESSMFPIPVGGEGWQDGHGFVSTDVVGCSLRDAAGYLEFVDEKGGGLMVDLLGY